MPPPLASMGAKVRLHLYDDTSEALFEDSDSLGSPVGRTHLHQQPLSTSQTACSARLISKSRQESKIARSNAVESMSYIDLTGDVSPSEQQPSTFKGSGASSTPDAG